MDLGHGCNGTTIDNVISWNGNISIHLLSIPSIALIERGGHNCHLWSHKINNALALSSQHNLNITAILITDNTTHDGAHTISLPTTDNNPPIWNNTLPPIRNATFMPDNDIDSTITTTTDAAVYFIPALYGAELKAMIRTYSNDIRRYIQLQMFFEETSFLVNTTRDDNEFQDDGDDGEHSSGSNNADRGYLAYVIAAATTLVFGKTRSMSKQIKITHDDDHSHHGLSKMVSQIP